MCVCVCVCVCVCGAAQACLFLREREGVRFVATNLDACAKYSNGRMCPGAGMLVAAVAKGSGVEPVVCGKPDQVWARGSASCARACVCLCVCHK